MDYLEAAKRMIDIPASDHYRPLGVIAMSTFTIAHVLIALVERIDRLTAHDADGNPAIRVKVGK